MSDPTPTLTIIFRYLCLCYGDPVKGGCWLLLPSDGHRGKLRDVVSGMEVPLFAARLRLDIEPNAAADGQKETKRANKYGASTMEQILGAQKPLAVQQKYLASVGDVPDLCLQAFLPAGTITTYPPAGFPEKGGEQTRIGGVVGKLTDTLIYSTDANVRGIIITSPHGTVRIEGGGRYEVTNDDERRSAHDEEKTQKEIEALKKFLEPQPQHANVMIEFRSDDIWPCPGITAGSFS